MKDRKITGKAPKKSKVSRRRFLKTGAIAAGGAAATLAAPNISRAQTVTLKMQSSWGATSPFQDMAKQYITRATSMAGGRLKIDLLPAGAVVKAFQVQDAVHKGVIDAAHSVAAYWYSKNKAASLFGTGPVFGCNAPQILAWIHFGGGKELLVELERDILKLNIRSFWAMPMPTQPLGWFKFHVTSLKQLQGLKYRTVGLATEIMQGLGMKVTQLPGGEIMPALEKGVIEAFEFNNPTADSRFGAQDVSKNYMMSSYHQAAEFFQIMFNKTKFNSLPKEHQAILEYSAEAASTANYGWAMRQYSKDLQWLMKPPQNVHVWRTGKDILEAELDSWDRVLKKLTKDPYFKKVVDSQKAWSKQVAFYNLMNDADYKLAYDHYFPGALPF